LRCGQTENGGMGRPEIGLTIDGVKKGGVERALLPACFNSGKRAGVQVGSSPSWQQCQRAGVPAPHTMTMSGQYSRIGSDPT
jgi:hypothetical protein